MKGINFLIAILVCSLVISCREDPPEIASCQTDRIVLVEEFTGMRCVNCPTGHRKIKELQQTYPNKIIPIAIHADDYYSAPKNGYDFRTADGNKMAEDIIPSGYPSVMVNRKFFEESGVYAKPLYNTWAGPIAEQLCLPADASIEVNPTYDQGTRKTTITVDIAPTNKLKMPEPIGLTVLVTESHVIGPQEGLSGWDYNYEHNHMLRDIITDTWGDKIQDGGKAISPYQANFEYTIPAGWEAENCHIVAYVHYQGGQKYILQATEKKLIP